MHDPAHRHVHIKGITNYRGVLGIKPAHGSPRPGSRKQMNVNPTQALAVVVDLQTLVPETFSFA